MAAAAAEIREAWKPEGPYFHLAIDGFEGVHSIHNTGKGYWKSSCALIWYVFV